MPISSEIIWRRQRPNIKFLLIVFHSLKMFSLHIVPLQGQTTCVELLNLPQWSIFAGPMMNGCGGVCVPLSPEQVVQVATKGLRSASRVSEPAYWASWDDSLSVIRSRHPEVAHQFVEELNGFPNTPFLRAAADAKRNLIGLMGFEPSSWEAVAVGARPPLREPEDFEPGTVRQGWQHEASSR